MAVQPTTVKQATADHTSTIEPTTIEVSPTTVLMVTDNTIAQSTTVQVTSMTTNSAPAIESKTVSPTTAKSLIAEQATTEPSPAEQTVAKPTTGTFEPTTAGKTTLEPTTVNATSATSNIAKPLATRAVMTANVQFTANLTTVYVAQFVASAPLTTMTSQPIQHVSTHSGRTEAATTEGTDKWLLVTEFDNVTFKITTTDEPPHSNVTLDISNTTKLFGDGNMVVILVVGVGILLIVAILIILFVVLKRRSKRKHTFVSQPSATNPVINENITVMINLGVESTDKNQPKTSSAQEMANSESSQPVSHHDSMTHIYTEMTESNIDTEYVTITSLEDSGYYEVPVRSNNTETA